MPTRPDPEGTTDHPPVERRRQPRDPDTPVDWECIVLQRMARRVRSLSRNAAIDAPDGTADGWEEAALRTLQRRVRALDSDE